MIYWEPSWSWSYGSRICNYLCNYCLSPLKLWVRTPLKRVVLDTTLCDKVWQWLTTGRWFSPGTTVSSTNKNDHNDITVYRHTCNPVNIWILCHLQNQVTIKNVKFCKILKCYFETGEVTEKRPLVLKNIVNSK